MWKTRDIVYWPKAEYHATFAGPEWAEFEGKPAWHNIYWNGDSPLVDFNRYDNIPGITKKDIKHLTDLWRKPAKAYKATMQKFVGAYWDGLHDKRLAAMRKHNIKEDFLIAPI